jgi:RNA polymerase sigma-70 factor (ECF subfamily)
MDSDITDEELMQRYAAGDASAFDALYTRHRGSLYRYFLRQCGSDAIAQELYQDVWMKLIHSHERYQPTALFKTWLYRLAHNHLIDFYRKKHPQNLSVDDSEDPDSLQSDDSWQPDNQFIMRRLGELIREKIAELPAVQREVFLLHEEAGLTLEQIATVTDINKEAVKSRFRYAVKKLRHALEDSR